MATFYAALAGLTVAGIMALAGSPARADTVLTSGNGNVSLGVESLGATGLYTGLALLGVGDAITPGCYCEGWGAGSTSGTGYSANDNGSANVNLVSGSGATSVVNISGTSLNVQQIYMASTKSGAMFVDYVTLTNTGASTLTLQATAWSRCRRVVPRTRPRR